MDFRNATAHFADKKFDGDPVRVKAVGETEDISEVDEEADDEPVVDELTGEQVDFPQPEKPDISIKVDDGPGTMRKVRVNGVDVSVINERVQYLGNGGKIITEDRLLTAMVYDPENRPGMALRCASAPKSVMHSAAMMKRSLSIK